MLNFFLKYQLLTLHTVFFHNTIGSSYFKFLTKPLIIATRTCLNFKTEHQSTNHRIIHAQECMSPNSPNRKADIELPQGWTNDTDQIISPVWFFPKAYVAWIFVQTSIQGF
jgi:hypothetical protein